MPPERVVERVKPVELTEPRPGVWVFKFPKAITGMVELDVEEPAGTRICMRYSGRVFTPDYLKYRTVQSVLHYENFQVSKEEANGLIGPSMMGVGIPFGVRVKGYGNRERVKLQLATPMDLYVCRGSGPETWHRRSAYTPFQFVELTGLTNKPSLETVTALIVHTDLPKTGTFHSSEPLFERIVEASDRSLIYCTHGIVQDNPGREKGGVCGYGHTQRRAGRLPPATTRLFGARSSPTIAVPFATNSAARAKSRSLIEAHTTGRTTSTTSTLAPSSR